MVRGTVQPSIKNLQQDIPHESSDETLTPNDYLGNYSPRNLI